MKKLPTASDKKPQITPITIEPKNPYPQKAVFKSNLPTTTSNDTSWERFMDGKLDLKTAFWGYGFFGSIVIGIGCGVLVETVSNVFNIVYVISITVLIIGLWQCASNYKKIMSQKKQSELWGVLTQVYCVLGALGLANFIKDLL